MTSGLIADGQSRSSATKVSAAGQRRKPRHHHRGRCTTVTRSGRERRVGREQHVERATDRHQLAMEAHLVVDLAPEPGEEAVDDGRGAEDARVDVCAVSALEERCDAPMTTLAMSQTVMP